jgi:hypothetical protein
MQRLISVTQLNKNTCYQPHKHRTKLAVFILHYMDLRNFFGPFDRHLPYNFLQTKHYTQLWIFLRVVWNWNIHGKPLYQKKDDGTEAHSH